MTKKIAVVVTNRVDEALRMSIGLTLADDEVNVFLVDQKLVRNDNNEMNLEAASELGVKIYSNCESADDLEQLQTQEMAKRLLSYDHILPY